MGAADPHLPRSTWRLVSMSAHDGATNMAIDEAILIAVAEGRAPPTIRFYGWDPPCVSIGHAQSMRGAVDLDACRQRGYTWVRRPTGGRAVLHIDELTYSVTAPQQEPRVAGDIVTSYRRLSRGLVAGLRRLGCDVVQAERQGDEADNLSAACFDVPAHYEVTVRGRKLIGSAQVRRRGIVLQHGALPLRGDVARLADVLALDDRERESLREKLVRGAIALGAALGREVAWDEVAAALAAGMSAALALDLVPADLTTYELAMATRLQAHYAGDDWTFSR
jgi:lipoate-protein ligase A